jgi:hypothetical protein
MKRLLAFGTGAFTIAAFAIVMGTPGIGYPVGAAHAANGTEYRHYYRHHGAHDWRRYYRPPVPAAPVRPLSCGEFRFWNGERCVDVRQSAPPTRTVRGRATSR